MAKKETGGKKLETEITREICDWLSDQNFFFWRSNNIPVFQKDKYGARFRSLPKYTPRGLPDIIVVHCGIFIALEVKIPDYWKFTDSQKEMRDKIILNGGIYRLVTSVTEVAEIMDPLKIGIMPLLLSFKDGKIQ